MPCRSTLVAANNFAASYNLMATRLLRLPKATYIKHTFTFLSSHPPLWEIVHHQTHAMLCSLSRWAALTKKSHSAWDLHCF